MDWQTLLTATKMDWLKLVNYDDPIEPIRYRTHSNPRLQGCLAGVRVECGTLRRRGVRLADPVAGGATAIQMASPGADYARVSGLPGPTYRDGTKPPCFFCHEA